MGKGNRAKQERAKNILAAGGKKNAKKTTPTWVGTAIVAGVLAFLILFAAFGVLDSRGVFVRGKVVASTKNYEISVPMMSYLVYTEYQNWVDTYQDSGYMQYIKGSGGDPLNTSKGLRDQKYSVVKDETTGVTTTTTWFDYFATSAGTQAEQILIFCECANAIGMKLGEEDYKEIDQAIALLEAYATISGYSTDAYLRVNYGKGVSLKDIRKMMELSQLAANYSEVREQEIKDGATSTRVDAFYEENKKDYDTSINYIGVNFEAIFTPVADTEADAATKNEEALAKYKAEQQKQKERVEALKACTTADEFSALLLSYFEEDAIAAGEQEPKAVALAKLQEVTFTNYEKPDSTTDMDTWLFSDTARVVGDANSFVEEKEGYTESTSKYTAATSKYGACIVTKALHRNDTPVRNVGHILLKSDTYKDLTSTSTLYGDAKELAQSILDSGETKVTAENMSKALLKKMLDEGAITEKTDENGKTYYAIDKDKFETFGNTYNGDSNIFYEDVTKGQMVATFEAWLFDEARIQGEISYPTAVKTDYGYHIMFYDGEGKETWFVRAKSALETKDYEAWYKEMQETHTIEVNSKNWNAIDG